MVAGGRVVVQEMNRKKESNNGWKAKERNIEHGFRRTSHNQLKVVKKRDDRWAENPRSRIVARVQQKNTGKEAQ